MTNEELKHYQDCCLIIADEIDRICKKHNIGYSITGGTLLGAVRHGGFIPWDDDMDMGMLREDYNKFIEICKTELNPKFHILNSETDKDFPFVCTKITLAGTKISEDFARDNAKYDEIFVDIFPYDKIPKNDDERNAVAKKVKLLKKILWIKKGYGKSIKNEGAKKRAKYNLAKVLCSLLPYNAVMKKRIALYQQFDNLSFDDCYIGDYEWPRTFDCKIKKDTTFGALKEYEFNGHSYLGFDNYDAYLSAYFNDYMTLPPEEMRHNHSIENVNFGEY